MYWLHTNAASGVGFELGYLHRAREASAQCHAGTANGTAALPHGALFAAEIQ